MEPDILELAAQYRKAKTDQREHEVAAQEAINVYNTERAAASAAEDHASMVKTALLKKLDEA